jgi:hypothetical protein
MKKFLFVLGFILLPLSFASAGTEHNLTGWAWSSNIGWISFNCTNVSVASCSGVNYGVTINASSTLNGFAWSPNIGWIQFGCPLGVTCLSGFPSGSGTYSVDAEKNGSTLRGWARALSNGDGWDGWISLGGTNHTIVASTSGAFLGYGWGSDVVGWTSFDIAGADGVRLGGAANLVAKSNGATLANGAIVQHSSDIELAYNLINMPTGQTCALSKTSLLGTPFATLPGIASSSSAYTGALDTDGATTTTYDYELSCTNGNVSTTTLGVQPQPPDFGFTGPSTAKIQFLSPATTTSDDMEFFVSPIGGFTDDVDISVSPLLPALDASTTGTYFLGNRLAPIRTYELNPTITILGANGGTALQLRSSGPFTGARTVTVTAASGSLTHSIVVTINPTVADPHYQEF